MTEVIVKVPADFKDILEEVDEPIYMEAIKNVVKQKLRAKEELLNDLTKQAANFEAKYSKKYDSFSKSVPDTLEGHEDWIQWSFVNAQLQKLDMSIAKIRLLLGK